MKPFMDRDFTQLSWDCHMIEIDVTYNAEVVGALTDFSLVTKYSQVIMYRLRVNTRE